MACPTKGSPHRYRWRRGRLLSELLSPATSREEIKHKKRKAPIKSDSAVERPGSDVFNGTTEEHAIEIID
jgi:hypothetical protein